jgi:hypothetical protein
MYPALKNAPWKNSAPLCKVPAGDCCRMQNLPWKTLQFEDSPGLGHMGAAMYHAAAK